MRQYAWLMTISMICMTIVSFAPSINPAGMVVPIIGWLIGTVGLAILLFDDLEEE